MTEKVKKNPKRSFTTTCARGYSFCCKNAETAMQAQPGTGVIAAKTVKRPVYIEMKFMEMFDPEFECKTNPDLIAQKIKPETIREILEPLAAVSGKGTADVHDWEDRPLPAAEKNLELAVAAVKEENAGLKSEIDSLRKQIANPGKPKSTPAS